MIEIVKLERAIRPALIRRGITYRKLNMGSSPTIG